MLGQAFIVSVEMGVGRRQIITLGLVFVQVGQRQAAKEPEE
jgi:hypothetical protein